MILYKLDTIQVGKEYYLTWFLEKESRGLQLFLPVTPVRVFARISSALRICLSLDQDGEGESVWSRDISEENIEREHRSLYPHSIFAHLSEELRETFFENLGLCTAEVV